MAITQEAAVASILPSALAKSKLANGVSSGIFADPSIGDQCFPGEQTLTVGNVLNKLANKCAAFQRRLAQGERVQGIDIAPLCATSGYTSNLFRCAIKMIGGDDPEAFRLILKVFSPERMENMFEQVMGKDKAEEVREQIAKMELEASRKRAESEAQMNGQQNGGVQNGGMEGQQPFIARMHRNECVFYDFIGANFTENPLPLPEVYFTQIGGGPNGEHGLIAMEDLHDAFLVDIGHGLNREQALNIIEHMAHLHAHVMHPKLADWKAQFMTPEEIFGMDEQPEESKAFFMEMIMAHAPVEIMGSLKRMKKLIANVNDFGKWVKRKMEEEYGMCDILTHGDLWVNNLLWHNSRPNELAAFIDWQLAQRAPPMTDIAYILLMCAEPELRHELEADGTVLAHYLNSMNGKLAEIGMPSAPFGLEELEHAYKLTQVGQSWRMIMALQLFNQTWDDVPEKERKLATLLRRSTVALEDSVKALEQEAPEWLVPADDDGEENSKEGGGEKKEEKEGINAD